MPVPTTADVVAYLGDGADRWKVVMGSVSAWPQIDKALAAEAAAQAAACRIPVLAADYPPDLGQALCRRVARALAMRALPLAVLQGDAEAGSLVLPGRDSEVRRLEGPYRRLVVG